MGKILAQADLLGPSLRKDEGRRAPWLQSAPRADAAWKEGKLKSFSFQKTCAWDTCIYQTRCGQAGNQCSCPDDPTGWLQPVTEEDHWESSACFFPVRMTFGKEQHRCPAYCIRFYLTSSRKATVPRRSPCSCSNGTRIWRVQSPPSSLFERVFSPWMKWLPTSNTIFLLSVSTITLSGCIELGFWGRYFRHVNRYPFIIWGFALQFLRKIGKISISKNQGYLEGLSEKQEQGFLFCCFLLHSEW